MSHYILAGQNLQVLFEVPKFKHLFDMKDEWLS